MPEEDLLTTKGQCCVFAAAADLMMDFLITKDESHPVAELFVLAEANI